MVAAYLEKVDPAFYTEAYVPYNRFGHFTSNINKSVNSVLKVDWKNDVLTLFGATWDRVMQSRFSRFCESQVEINQQHYWTPKCASLMKESRSFAGGLCVRMSDGSKAKVVTPENLVYDVEANWESQRTQCLCKRLQQTELPCGHIRVMLLDQNKDLRDFIPWA